MFTIESAAPGLSIVTVSDVKPASRTTDVDAGAMLVIVGFDESRMTATVLLSSSVGSTLAGALYKWSTKLAGPGTSTPPAGSPNAVTLNWIVHTPVPVVGSTPSPEPQLTDNPPAARVVAPCTMIP